MWNYIQPVDTEVRVVATLVRVGNQEERAFWGCGKTFLICTLGACTCSFFETNIVPM